MRAFRASFSPAGRHQPSPRPPLLRHDDRGPGSNNHAHAQPDVVGRAARGSAFSKGTAVCPRGPRNRAAQGHPPPPRHRVNRAAHLLMPPLRRTNAASGSAFVLYSAAYRSTRDHLDRVRLSTFCRSAVHKITIANGSSVVGKSAPCSRSAHRARLMARSSAVHHITRSNTALRYP